MNNLVIAGRLGKDAEVRTTQVGDVVTSWSVGVSERKGGENSTTWFDCSMWGDRGEKLAQYLKKGSPVTVSGNVSAREHNGKAYITVRVHNVTLQSSKGDSQPSTHNQTKQDGYQPSATLDDEIPF